MATRSQSSKGRRAPRVGVSSSTFSLLLILCGSIPDAQGQGKVFFLLFLIDLAMTKVIHRAIVVIFSTTWVHGDCTCFLINKIFIFPILMWRKNNYCTEMLLLGKAETIS